MVLPLYLSIKLRLFHVETLTAAALTVGVIKLGHLFEPFGDEVNVIAII